MELEANGPEVAIEVDGEVLGRWPLDLENYPRELALPVRRPDLSTICLINEDQRSCANFAPGQTRPLRIAYAGGVIATVIRGQVEIPPARFDEAYQAAYRGRTIVEVPEVYELVNIAIALTPFGQEDEDMVYREGAYYRAVQAHFGPYRDHPLIGRIEAMLREDRASYSPFKMNGYAFNFDEQGMIVRSPVYDRTGFAGSLDNPLLPFLDDLQDFSEISQFRSFYARNASVYGEQIRFFEEDADVSGMSSWLAERFPSVRPYDGVKIIFSPLVAYNQSLTTIEADGYRELQPHINYPYGSNPRLSPQGAAIQRTAILFTEMNHGFVDPIAAQYRDALTAAFADRAPWADDTRAPGYYPGAENLFNEYMNWALVSLYFHDVMDPADFEIAHRDMVDNMQNGRGFLRFAVFDAELLRLYRTRPPGASVENLYQAIVAWAQVQTVEPIETRALAPANQE
ncbi:DUF4932 domain-containing protein [Qipengyuania qiaonensis]|uniref:DUF4932 domain-containing protein n=1 Tax=Qipengyuania qiaonensis TaxID=2867240 RepID=A0ABS7J2R1_9SPHN|nr:DUF4932 domain-containing protein [Qipengyuania qiaonensis]MBX7481612.1 DUF4932 domain-containing protein [Qipengyuania qiaonensis]